jgi:hypothetical protein
MSRTHKFMALGGVFFRLEARATREGWRVKVFRNGKFVADTEGRPQAFDDHAIAEAFAAARILAEQGIWERGATGYPWNASKDK